MDWFEVLFLLQLVSTVFLTGLIWFVQVVHYPLFALVGEAQAKHYSGLHATRTGWVVFGPMVIELLTALAWLWPGMRPGLVPSGFAWVGAGLVLAIWGSTGLLQVPMHERLARGPDSDAVRRLVRTNWIRTVAWTLRSLLLVWSLSIVMHTLQQRAIGF